jgi:hypothetical protein
VKVLEKRREAQELKTKQDEITCADRTQFKLNGWRNLYAIQKVSVPVVSSSRSALRSLPPFYGARSTSSDGAARSLSPPRNPQGKDVRHRPPDQRYLCRIYSRIDDDVWERGELRGWYQQYSTPQPRDVTDNVRSGYSLYSTTLGMSHSQSAPTLSAHMSGAPRALVPKGPKDSFAGGGGAEPHFLDYEGCTLHQRRAAQARLEAKHAFPPEPIGVKRVPGFRQAPWKDRPTG